MHPGDFFFFVLDLNFLEMIELLLVVSFQLNEVFQPISTGDSTRLLIQGHFSVNGLIGGK